MKRFWSCLVVVIMVLAATAPLSALDLGKGFSIGGGVKTGILIKNSDYTGKLAGAAHGDQYPMTLYFASQDNEAYKGEGWLNFAYASEEKWGLNLSFWSHGNLEKFEDFVHLGDYYLWANLLDKRLRFIAGNGGGTPISSGGWINADWLSYMGLRVFWVDPKGFSFGINFPNPDSSTADNKAEGIKPVNYLSTIMFGGKFETGKFWASLMFDNSPIFDDTNANYDGGLHRPIDAQPIAQSGNIGFGIGMNELYFDKGMAAFDGIVMNLGEDDVDSPGGGTYKISPIVTVLALKTGLPITEQVYAELKGKYHIKSGDNADNTASTAWGKFEIEPYVSYQFLPNFKFQTSINYTGYVNSYYLATDISIGAITIPAGWAPPNPSAYDYYSVWVFTVDPSFEFTFEGIKAVLGYKGTYSRDHAANTLYLDLRWSF